MQVKFRAPSLNVKIYILVATVKSLQWQTNYIWISFFAFAICNADSAIMSHLTSIWCQVCIPREEQLSEDELAPICGLFFAPPSLHSSFCCLIPIMIVFHWIGFKVRLKNVYNVDKIGFKVRLKCTRMCCGIIWSGLGQLLPVCPEENAARGRHYVIHLFSFVCSQLETGCGYFPSISISKPPRCCATAAKGLTKNQYLHRSHTLVNLLVPFKIIPVCFNDIYFKTK